jgi:hypothetical protein
MLTMVAANAPQVPLWPAQRPIALGLGGDGSNGTGGNWIPIMTFADFCFLAAEFVLRANVTSTRTAQEWYETGVRASLDHWNYISAYSAVVGHQPMTAEEINTFLNMPNISWNPAMALEQIYAQSYVEHFKNPLEAWALVKRTNFPNTTSPIVTFETPMTNGNIGIIPRRARFNMPGPGEHNFDNLVRRIEDMQRDPHFGEPTNEFGRVWWDAPLTP